MLWVIMMIKKEKTRNSSIELLRIFSILGILLLHTFGDYYGIVTGFNLKYGLGVNSLFNASVTVFFLISGFYGIKDNKEKVIKIWLMVIFYSILQLIVMVNFYHIEVDGKLLIKYLMPITNGDYTFMRSYIIIAIFAKYINKITESMKKSELKGIILFSVIIFYIIPTITKYQFLADSGKGIINMLIVYVIGRYISYYVKDVSRIKVVCIGALSLIIELLLNANATAAAGFVGVRAPYAYDYSIFILIIGVCILLFFKTFNFNNKVINFVAKSVLAVNLIDPIVRMIVPKYIDMSYTTISNYLPIYMICYSILIYLIGFIFDLIRKTLLGKPESFLSKKILCLCERISKFICKDKKLRS